MIKNNLLITHFQKRETALKWLFFGFGYFILFVFLENPVHKTISLIGKEHLILFTAFCFIYSVSLLVNLSYMRKNLELKGDLFYYMSFVISSMYGFVATTLMYDKSVGTISTFATVVHWVIGFGGILINTVCVLVFLLRFCKKNNSNTLKVSFWLCTLTCIADLLVFALLSLIKKGNVQESKNGFLEIVPMAVTYIVIYIINHTDLVSSRKERDLKEEYAVTDDTSVFSAVCFGTLAACFVSFTFFAFVRNPIHYTISMTGVDYPIGFAVTGFLLAIAFVLNFIAMFIGSGYKNPIAWFLAVVGPLAIILCVVSPTKLGTELDPVHSVSAIVFFFFIFLAFLMYYCHFAKDVKRRKVLFVLLGVLAATLLTMLFLFVIFKQKYGRTGLTELIPIELFLFCFFFENNSYCFSTQAKKEKQVVA